MSINKDQEKIIENFDWNQLPLERLKLLQSQISQAINLKIQDSQLTENTVNLNENYGYKASVAKVFPHSLNSQRSSLYDYQKCVFITSLGGKNFVDSKRLEACIKWISKNFKACVVIVNDSIYRLTIEVRQGIKGNEAWLEAIRTAEKFVNENYLLFQEYSEKCQFHFKMASEIEKRSHFNIYYEELQSLYQKKQSFQSMVNSFAQTYLNRGEQVEVEQVEELKQKHLATTYLLEESALFTCLAEEVQS